MFTIQEDSFGSLTQLELTNVLTGEYVTIIHDYGTCVNEMVLQANGKNYSIIRGTNDSRTMVNKKWFKSAKLTPYPNRVKDGKYSFNGNSYQLSINDEERKNAMHGFVFDKPFELISHKEGQEECSVELEYTYTGKQQGYPFPFRLNIIYVFSEDGLECETILTNTGKDNMPLGDGWHPYFKTGTKIDRMQLAMPPCKQLETDNRLIPTGKTKDFNKFIDDLEQIGNQEFDTCFLLEDNGDDTATFELYDPDRDIYISLWQETGKGKYNYTQLYIPPDRQSIAIEPMTCAPDAFNNGMGLQTLAPGEAFRGRYGISLR